MVKSRKQSKNCFLQKQAKLPKQTEQPNPLETVPNIKYLVREENLSLAPLPYCFLAARYSDRAEGSLSCTLLDDVIDSM